MCKALIIDESPIQRMLANNALVTMDYMVFEAPERATAVRFCKWSMPELIVLDWTSDAMDCLGEIRALPDGLRPTVLVCSGADDPGQMMLAIASGADDFLAKPLSRDEIEAKLARVYAPIAWAA